MNLEPIKTFCDSRPWPTPGAIRALIFQFGPAMQSAGALVRVGRRILIDPERFDAWIRQRPQGEHACKCAAGCRP